jgi:hypothetical protein
MKIKSVIPTLRQRQSLEIDRLARDVRVRIALRRVRVYHYL